ncbi:MAG: TadE/TadG family type IV pilus assembly protein [Pseudomonadota bacterium]
MARYLQTWFQRFRKNEDGTAAIEFALIVPILMALYLGAADFGQAMSLNLRVKQIAGSMTDLIAREEQVDTCTLDKMISVSELLMATARAGNVSVSDLQISMVSLQSGADRKAKVMWGYDFSGASASSGSCGNGTNYTGSSAAYTAGNDYPGIDPDLMGANSGLIVVDVQYQFEPLFLKVINTITQSTSLCGGAQAGDAASCKFTLNDRDFQKPRNANSRVACIDC